MRHDHRLLLADFLSRFAWQTLATSRSLVSPLFVAFALGQLATAQDFEQGKALWATQCASCHGSTGQGVENHFADPLTGDLSNKELASVIQATMPEGATKSLTDPQAQDLAQVLHHEFNSPPAPIRTPPPHSTLLQDLPALEQRAIRRNRTIKGRGVALLTMMPGRGFIM